MHRKDSVDARLLYTARLRAERARSPLVSRAHRWKQARPLSGRFQSFINMSPTRDGVFTDPIMTKTFAATIRMDPTFAPTVTGDVYAQPLYVTDGPGAKEAFVIATESNHVTAISASGAVIWDQTFGTPAALTNLPSPCGNIDPLGITGTPVIDMASRTIYFDAMTLPPGAGPADHPKHFVHAVSLDDGTESAGGWPVDVDASVHGFDSFSQNQRGALALVHGVVYVPYGGHNGDCSSAADPYYGWVLGIPVAAPGSVTAFSTGTIGKGSTQGGIWAVGGVASTDDGASLFVTTGNTGGALRGRAARRCSASPRDPRSPIAAPTSFIRRAPFAM